MMSERGNAIEAEHRARSLDRVERPEGGIDQVAGTWRVLEIEQGLFKLLQEVLRLLPEGFCGIDGRHQPRTFFTTPTSWSCWNGFVIQPVAPAALASFFMFSSDSVVRKRIGTPL